jgi:hypothetical protein
MPHKLDYQTPVDQPDIGTPYIGIVSLLGGFLSMVLVSLECGGLLPIRDRYLYLVGGLPCLGMLCSIFSLIGERKKSFAWLGVITNGTVILIFIGEIIFAQWMFGGMTR